MPHRFEAAVGSASCCLCIAMAVVGQVHHSRPYLSAALIEDVMLVLFLRNPAALNEPAFGALSCATYVKVRTAGLAIGILLILGGTALVKVWLLPVA